MPKLKRRSKLTVTQLAESLRARGFQGCMIFPNGAVQFVGRWSGQQFENVEALDKWLTARSSSFLEK